MHLISTIPGGWNPNDEGVFHVVQKPGDIIFMSSADTELFTLNKAYKKMHDQETNLPSLRLANLGYFKQELTIDTYLDEVVSESKVVVMRMLGGKSYFPYLCEAMTDFAEENDIALIFLPGDNKLDLELMNMSTLALDKVISIWNYFVEGGIQNIQEGISLIMNETLKTSLPVENKVSIPDFFLYHPEQGIIKESNDDAQVLIMAYRSTFVADNLEPIDELIYSLKVIGVQALALMALSYRDENVEEIILNLLHKHNLSLPKVIINTTGFSIQGFNSQLNEGIFEKIGAPCIQAIMAGCNKETWENGSFGLPPTDVAMNIALPEVDGKIITKAISFKEALPEKDPLTDADIVRYVNHQEGCEFVVRHTLAWMNLASKNNDQKRIALIMPNYPNKDSRLANGVGLDTPASTIEILSALERSGYDLGDSIPRDTEELIELMTETVTNDLDSLYHRAYHVFITEEDFYKKYNRLSEELRLKVEEQWGHPNSSPNYREGKFIIPGTILENVFLSIQPSRGYNLDLQASYHSPDLPPTYAYLAYYFWMQEVFDADAVVHIGKHGNLEWLPGKSVALSEGSCFPTAIFDALPHFYPFIINDPGEGTQAKRRTHAVILDHLIPPMTRAENYGDLLKLELLVDEYYESALMDAKRAKLVKSKIESLVQSTQLSVDLGHQGDDVDELLEAIDGYLCELKEAQIRGGLHIFGKMPIGEKLIDLIVAMHRVPQMGLPGFTQALAEDFDLGFDPLEIEYSDPFEGEILGISCRTYGQAVEMLEEYGKQKVWSLIDGDLSEDNFQGKFGHLLQNIKEYTLPILQATQDEIGNLLEGLNGKFVPAGGSGAPTRGRLDILPTGKNFYSVDVRTVPSESAYQLGKKSAQNIIDRYLQEEGEYPKSIGISVWGTATMRTSGDDIAQALALMGVKPIWQGANRRVKDFEVISLIELGRPRIDVMLRISGFFRDAFPDIISLFNTAVEKVALLDEPNEQNPIKERFERERDDWKSKGLDEKTSYERSLYRVFGSKPEAYGAGLQGLIDGQNWENREDLANVYMNWSGYAYYGDKNQGKSAHETFKIRLKNIDVVMQNQDNREHDLLDSDDYYQFQGGLTSAVYAQKGEEPKTYFGDHSRPDNPRVKSLKEELLKVYRSRAVNPKWLQGMRDHGYKGAFEMSATLDYMFAYDATTNLVEDFMYEGMAEAYLMDEENRAFIQQHNPWALKDMSERLLEAMQRGMWQSPDPKLKQAIQDLYLTQDGELEGR
ncbi:cobaltochelatase subunit CobN [Aureibacter tunicatorum]|nr:cobaltochelatase subunit CobN [Aureibacter tunicatorum]